MWKDKIRQDKMVWDKMRWDMWKDEICEKMR